MNLPVAATTAQPLGRLSFDALRPNERPFDAFLPNAGGDLSVTFDEWARVTLAYSSRE